MLYPAVLLLLILAFIRLPVQSQCKSSSHQGRSKIITARKFTAYRHHYPSPSKKYVLAVTIEEVPLFGGNGGYPVLKIYPMSAKGKGKNPLCRIGWGDSWLWLPNHPHTLVFSEANKIYLWSSKTPTKFRQIAVDPTLQQPHHTGFEIVLRGASPDGRTVYYSYFPLTELFSRGKEQKRSITIRD